MAAGPSAKISGNVKSTALVPAARRPSSTTSRPSNTPVSTPQVPQQSNVRRPSVRRDAAATSSSSPGVIPGTLPSTSSPSVAPASPLLQPTSRSSPGQTSIPNLPAMVPPPASMTTQPTFVQPQKARPPSQDTESQDGLRASHSGVDTDPARVYRYPIYTPDRFCISAQVPPPPFFVRQVGRMYVMAEKTQADGTPKLFCVVGPCWPMIFITFMLITCVSLAVFVSCLPNLPFYFSIVAGVVLGIVIIAFCVTACTDPGIQRIHDQPKDSTWTYSEPGQTYRQPHAIYDVEAQVIIKHTDHFCPWTGTIIAAGNLRPFYVFTSSLCLLLIVVLGILIIRVVHVF
mmetsp:Transcript_19945/g.39159  ORF Transcript_19945/g.39159 Transcript_19945/m.39159 type:complete len:344 (-) Transcript_19945:2024-3055(-)|eukprot:CAMPEP_0171484472 /NCGR_PEP_ID=MMETSP0958-20121227/22_1 /TAXON_ID=87120 /ORGANISM="Aurantiochytrium limacinum, Strain ATCCMYA-1381" /LENGTH=343 /DNA_ID=CAMNT_0012017181 /DNA_START=312 /DNA_END=1343 /DNA_ORIENTATION=+